MKKFLLGIAVLAIATASADARNRYEGHFVIKAKSGTCTAYNPVGSRGNVHFEPVITGVPDENRASFVLYEALSAKGYRLKANGNFTTAFKAVDTIYTADDFGPDDSATVLVRFTTQPKINVNTNFINVVAQIRNFDFMPGCTVNVDLSMIKRLP